MTWPRTRLIFVREVRDQLRDRRTLFMIVVLPVLLYPALGLGLMQLTMQFRQEERRIGFVGAEYLPDSPPLLDPAKERFLARLFVKPSSQKYYQVSTHNPRNGTAWTRDDLLAGRIDVLVVVPEDTSQRLDAGERIRLEVLRNDTSEKSKIAHRDVVHCLESWATAIVGQRMLTLEKPRDYADPLEIEEEEADISPSPMRAGTIWGRFFPFLIVMMTLTGAFYPAIDLCAGEKERGTMETLLITPAARGEIVMGKFLAILLFSVATTLFNLVSMGLTFGQISSMLPDSSGRLASELSAPSLGAIWWMLVLMLPLAAFFSALCMALAVFARSTKEGQYYLMPTFLVVSPLIFITLAPGVELTPFYSLVPVTNVALLLRALMLNQYDKAMVFLLPVLVPTILYSYLALRFALEQFNREEVLFREAERFEVGLWVRHLLRDKEPTPSTAEAWSLYVLMLLLIWYSQGHFPPTLGTAAAAQLAFIGFPALVMSLLLTSDTRRTLALRTPLVLPTILALLLVFAIHPATIMLANALQQLLPPNDELQHVLQQMLSASLTEKLIVMAVLPAICEEIAFRGFILAGLLRKHPPARAILISGILFGVFHMIPQQMVTASILGIVLGIIATRTGSIFPGMIFHATHNCLGILHVERARQVASATDSPMVVEYELGWLVMSSLASALLVGYLASRPSRLPASEDSLKER